MAPTTTDLRPLRALALACTLTPSRARSSSVLLGEQLLERLGEHGVEGDVVRVVDHAVEPGVQVDMGDGDDWPGIPAAAHLARLLPGAPHPPVG